MRFLQKFHPLLTVILLYIPDQLSKFYAVKYLVSGESFPLIKNVIHITLVYNTGAAFGMLKPRSSLFAAIAIAAIFFINFLLLRKSHTLKPVEKVSLYLILAGALGNLTDRVRLGAVVDFIDLLVWPVFNLADCFITIGALLLGLSILGIFGRENVSDNV
jgi:signal peptidase II